jgi:DNA-binding transcriptional ArsR family regulator
MENLAQLFVLLGETIRLKLLALLTGGERCVCKLYEPLGLPQSTVSRHLMLLKTAGVVASRRVGTWMHYRLSPETWKDEWKEVLPVAIEAAKKQLVLLDGSDCNPEKPCSIPVKAPQTIHFN